MQVQELYFPDIFQSIKLDGNAVCTVERKKNKNSGWLSLSPAELAWFAAVVFALLLAARLRCWFWRFAGLWPWNVPGGFLASSETFLWYGGFLSKRSSPSQHQLLPCFCIQPTAELQKTQLCVYRVLHGGFFLNVAFLHACTASPYGGANKRPFRGNLSECSYCALNCIKVHVGSAVCGHSFSCRLILSKPHILYQSNA